ncbi:MAG: hypothetical protein AAGJ79_05885 [Verrucomicrobiota bacterium]
MKRLSVRVCLLMWTGMISCWAELSTEMRERHLAGVHEALLKGTPGEAMEAITLAEKAGAMTHWMRDRESNDSLRERMGKDADGGEAFLLEFLELDWARDLPFDTRTITIYVMANAYFHFGRIEEWLDREVARANDLRGTAKARQAYLLARVLDGAMEFNEADRWYRTVLEYASLSDIEFWEEAAQYVSTWLNYYPDLAEDFAFRIMRDPDLTVNQRVAYLDRLPGYFCQEALDYLIEEKPETLAEGAGALVFSDNGMQVAEPLQFELEQQLKGIPSPSPIAIYLQALFKHNADNSKKNLVEADRFWQASKGRVDVRNFIPLWSLPETGIKWADGSSLAGEYLEDRWLKQTLDFPSFSPSGETNEMVFLTIRDAALRLLASEEPSEVIKERIEKFHGEDASREGILMDFAKTHLHRPFLDLMEEIVNESASLDSDLIAFFRRWGSAELRNYVFPPDAKARVFRLKLEIWDKTDHESVSTEVVALWNLMRWAGSQEIAAAVAVDLALMAERDFPGVSDDDMELLTEIRARVTTGDSELWEKNLERLIPPAGARVSHSFSQQAEGADLELIKPDLRNLSLPLWLPRYSTPATNLLHSSFKSDRRNDRFFRQMRGVPFEFFRFNPTLRMNARRNNTPSQSRELKAKKNQILKDEMERLLREEAGEWPIDRRFRLELTYKLNFGNIAQDGDWSQVAPEFIDWLEESLRADSSPDHRLIVAQYLMLQGTRGAREKAVRIVEEMRNVPGVQGYLASAIVAHVQGGILPSKHTREIPSPYPDPKRLVVSENIRLDIGEAMTQKLDQAQARINAGDEGGGEALILEVLNQAWCCPGDAALEHIRAGKMLKDLGKFDLYFQELWREFFEGGSSLDLRNRLFGLSRHLAEDKGFGLPGWLDLAQSIREDESGNVGVRSMLLEYHDKLGDYEAGIEFLCEIAQVDTSCLLRGEPLLRTIRNAPIDKISELGQFIRSSLFLYAERVSYTWTGTIGSCVIERLGEANRVQEALDLMRDLESANSVDEIDYLDNFLLSNAHTAEGSAAIMEKLVGKAGVEGDGDDFRFPTKESMSAAPSDSDLWSTYRKELNETFGYRAIAKLREEGKLKEFIEGCQERIASNEEGPGWRAIAKSWLVASVMKDGKLPAELTAMKSFRHGSISSEFLGGVFDMPEIMRLEMRAKYARSVVMDFLKADEKRRVYWTARHFRSSDLLIRSFVALLEGGEKELARDLWVEMKPHLMEASSNHVIPLRHWEHVMRGLSLMNEDGSVIRSLVDELDQAGKRNPVITLSAMRCLCAAGHPELAGEMWDQYFDDLSAIVDRGVALLSVEVRERSNRPSERTPHEERFMGELVTVANLCDRLDSVREASDKLSQYMGHRWTKRLFSRENPEFPYVWVKTLKEGEVGLGWDFSTDGDQSQWSSLKDPGRLQAENSPDIEIVDEGGVLLGKISRDSGKSSATFTCPPDMRQLAVRVEGGDQRQVIFDVPSDQKIVSWTPSTFWKVRSLSLPGQDGRDVSTIRLPLGPRGKLITSYFEAPVVRAEPGIEISFEGWFMMDADTVGHCWIALVYLNEDGRILGAKVDKTMEEEWKPGWIRERVVVSSADWPDGTAKIIPGVRVRPKSERVATSKERTGTMSSEPTYKAIGERSVNIYATDAWVTVYRKKAMSAELPEVALRVPKTIEKMLLAKDGKEFLGANENQWLYVQSFGAEDGKWGEIPNKLPILQILPGWKDRELLVRLKDNSIWTWNYGSSEIPPPRRLFQLGALEEEWQIDCDASVSPSLRWFAVPCSVPDEAGMGPGMTLVDFDGPAPKFVWQTSLKSLGLKHLAGIEFGATENGIALLEDVDRTTIRSLTLEDGRPLEEEMSFESYPRITTMEGNSAVDIADVEGERNGRWLVREKGVAWNDFAAGAFGTAGTPTQILTFAVGPGGRDLFTLEEGGFVRRWVMESLGNESP